MGPVGQWDAYWRMMALVTENGQCVVTLWLAPKTRALGAGRARLFGQEELDRLEERLVGGAAVHPGEDGTTAVHKERMRHAVELVLPRDALPLVEDPNEVCEIQREIAVAGPVFGRSLESPAFTASTTRSSGNFFAIRTMSGISLSHSVHQPAQKLISTILSV